MKPAYIRAAQLLVVLAGIFHTTNSNAQPVKLRIAWSAMPGHLIPVLYKAKPEILKHYGKTYVVEPIRFNGSAPQLTAVAAGEIDIATLAPANFVLGVRNARLNLRVVGDLLQDAAGWHSEEFVAPVDANINSVADLKGKRIATNAIGSAMDTGLRAMLRKSGLDPNRDVTMLEVAFPNMPAMLEEKKVDFAAMQQPFSTRLLATGKYKVLFRNFDAMGGNTQGPFLASRAETIEKNREVLKDYFEDHVRALRWFLAPENRAEAQKIIADFMKVPPEQLKYVFTNADYFRDPWARPNVEGIQRAIDVAVDVGMLKQGLTVAPDYVDLSFVDEAKRRIESK
jgi:sulfonate transport system substrate-binding protein